MADNNFLTLIGIADNFLTLSKTQTKTKRHQTGVAATTTSSAMRRDKATQWLKATRTSKSVTALSVRRRHVQCIPRVWLQELFERYMRVESEIKLLQDDKKQLLAEFKDRIDPKAFQSALRAVKIISKVKPDEKQDFDQSMLILEKVMCLEHVD